jgi:PAS domain S-box-containing protein
MDMNLRFTYVSPSVERLRGYTAEEVLMMPGLNALAPASRETAEKAFQRILESEVDPSAHPWDRETLELELICKDGSTLWAETTFTPLRNRENRLTGFLGISRDITERRKAAETQKMLESQLTQAQKMESIGTLAGGIAHDFNNILSAIIGYTEIAIEDIAEPEVALNDLKDVLKAGNRARTLISQILTFSRKADISYSPLSLHSAVKESLQLLRSAIPATIEIRQDLEDIGFVLSHPTHIQQIIMNLCTNAAHAMDKTGGTLHVTLTSAVLEGAVAQSLQVASGDYLKLSVSDTGHGIAPQIIERIYDPYFTTKESGRGTGLGLAVVHGIVKSHKGAILCKSIPDAGTTFDVYLPKITPIGNKRTLSEKSLFPGTERILFVDDEAALVDIAGKNLGKLGYQVTARTSSVDALALFMEQPHNFDLVITDMTMPEVTGDNLARKIAEIRPDIPIILCTGYSKQILAEHETPAGIKAFLQKPLKITEWSETIRRVLDNAKSSESAQA